MQQDRVVLAELIKPRGNRGEVLAMSQTDVPGRLEQLRKAHTRLRDGTDFPVELTEAWPHKSEWVLKFAGVDSIEQAERFRGAELWVPFAERAQLPDSAYFESDLIGCSLVDHVTSQALGVVTGWQHFGGPPLMEAQCGGREVLIPFVPEICPEVSVENRRILVRLPDGLLEL